jgi:HAD superfamily hydrolase (TIGR01459 family)
MPADANVPLIEGIEGIADQYDGFILDLWGTIHDGYRPLPGAVACLEALRARDKRILILSNAPRRAASAIERMDHIGVPGGVYDSVLTSGESANIALRGRVDDWHKALGSRCYLLGPPEDDSALDGVADTRAADLASADYILAVGSFERTDTVDDYAEFLAEAREKGLPMLCANPDLEVLRGDVPEICSGAIATRYEAMGGDVFWHGKPYPDIYRQSLELLEIDTPARILGVGDSLRTDIAGGMAAGIDTLFITSGLEARRLGTTLGQAPAPEALAALLTDAQAAPTYAAALFRWD